MSIALVGFMGSGKTTVGRRLAQKLGYRFVDVDHVIEVKTGISISELFAARGEPGFRKVEASVLTEVAGEAGVVLACGGGVVLLEENRRLLREKMTVVYLKAGADRIFQRVGHTGDRRPLLRVADPMAEIERMINEREPLYKEVADIVVETSSRSVDVVVEDILRALEAQGMRID